MVSFRTSSYEQVPWYAEIVGFFLVLLQTLFVVGLRMLGQQLGNPYGEDFIDLQLITYITMVLTTTMRILESADNVTLQTIDHTTEEELRQRMVPIGDGYEITPPKHHHHRRSKKGGVIRVTRFGAMAVTRFEAMAVVKVITVRMRIRIGNTKHIVIVRDHPRMNTIYLIIKNLVVRKKKRILGIIARIRVIRTTMNMICE